MSNHDHEENRLVNLQTRKKKTLTSSIGCLANKKNQLTFI